MFLGQEQQDYANYKRAPMDISDIQGAHSKKLHVRRGFENVANSIIKDNSQMVAAGSQKQPNITGPGMNDVFKMGNQYHGMVGKDYRNFDVSDINGPKRNQYGVRMEMQMQAPVEKENYRHNNLPPRVPGKARVNQQHQSVGPSMLWDATGGQSQGTPSQYGGSQKRAGSNFRQQEHFES